VTGAEERYGGNAGGRLPGLTVGDGSLSNPMLQADDDAADAPYERVEMVIRRLFAVGLDLHGALGHIHEHVDEEAAARTIRQAIFALDETIKQFRGMVLDLWPVDRTVPGGIRSSVVRAVERAHRPGGGCPVITLSGGADFPDEGLAHQIGAVLKQIFDLIPADRLPSARLEVASDPPPLGRLTVHIDVPGADLGDVADRLGAPSGERVTISSEAVTVPASHSYIHLECLAAAP
jgi:hypothetical protein